jgi:hypothetical protein
MASLILGLYVTCIVHVSGAIERLCRICFEVKCVCQSVLCCIDFKIVFFKFISKRGDVHEDEATFGPSLSGVSSARSLLVC